MHNSEERMMMQLNDDLKVLYVEDSKIVRESTYDMMQEFFVHIDVAVDGIDGLQKYKAFYEMNKTHYDIVFTDINMPNMDGIAMSEAILSENKDQDIVIISAHNESEYLIKLINMGVSNFILKPIEIGLFQKVLSRLINVINNEKMLQKRQEELLSINVLLEVANKEAQQATFQKSLFLANMSHEIRTPLNAIMGFISLLHKHEKDSAKLKYLQVIQNSSDSLLQIINDVLDISKIESGKMKLNPVDFNPYKDLINIGELFQVKAAEKGLILKIKYNNNMPKSLYADLLKIKQIFSNLLSNAIKFTPEGGIVKCIIWYANETLNIRVKDYGIGIPKEKQVYVFEKFAQAEDSTVREYGGTGLGLSISQKLAHILDATLTMESEENKGSIFMLRTPMRLGREKERGVPVANDNVQIKGHILLVEDNESSRMFVGIVLNNAGLTYDTAEDGEDAIEKFKIGNYDLILMDENMPKLSGSDATKAILQIEKQLDCEHTPIISLTANAFSGDKQRFLDIGMDDYLSKPIEPVVLIDMIQKHLVSE